jgi:type II secretory pathway component PulF
MAIETKTITKNQPLQTGRPAKRSMPLAAQLRASVAWRRRIRAGEIGVFTSQLALMLEIGNPLSSALPSIAREIPNPEFRRVIREIALDIENGKQFSQAMERHGAVFGQTYISMVRAGESGGFLREVLQRMVEMHEKRQAMLTQLRSALTYPVVLAIAGVLVILFILIGVLPKFTAFFAGKENILPWITRFLMGTSASLKTFWWAYLLLVTGLYIGAVILAKLEKSRRILHHFLIRGPLVARLANQIYIGEMLRTLGNLLQSRVPLLEALELTRTTIANSYYRQLIDGIREHVREGGKFSAPFAEYPQVPATVKQMVTIGEEAGKLPRVMLRLSRHYDLEVDQGLKKFAAMVEPLALIMMGAVVGLIVASVILPMFKLAQVIH